MESEYSAALSALKLYEETASAEREAHTSLLPGREHLCLNHTLPVMPPVNSQLLPTDPEASKYPDKTLISVSPTGSLSPEKCKRLREEDANHCAKHFSGRVVFSPLDVVLARLGTSALVGKLAELTQVARSQLKWTLKKAVLNSFENESNPSSNPAHRRIDDRYWLARLADAASTGHSLPLALDYIPTPAEALPAQKQHSYHKAREYDAALRASAAAKSTVFNILLNVEFTSTEAPNVVSNPLIGASANVAKYQQAITNADDLLTFQPTRLFVPTLSFHGKGEKTKLFISILSQERLEFAVVDDCFDSEGFPTVSALLHLFRIVSLYQVGYNPLFTYNFTSPPPNFSVGDAVPASVVLPGAPGVVRLNGKYLSLLRSAPFQRSTLVLEGELVKQSPGDKRSTFVVVKASFISERRVWRERIVVDALYAADPEHPPAYAPKLLAAFSAHAPASLASNPSEGKRKAGDLLDLPAVVPNHLELMLFASSPDGRKLKELSAAEFLSAAEQLFGAILDAFRRRVLHRDVSINNILLADDQLLLVDWEIGRRFEELSSAATRGPITGTLDTMSVASLVNDDPLPHDDVESAVYVLLKVLTQTFRPPVDQQVRWAQQLDAYYWDDPNMNPLGLSSIREGLWANSTTRSTIPTTRRFFQAAGHEARAALVLALLSLPLPAERWGVNGLPCGMPSGINTADYHEILSSLEDLVEKAVDAVRSIDVNKLIKEWV